MFVRPTGGIPRRTNFQATWDWAIEKVGVPGVHVYDLRHAGNMLAAESASLQESMTRMGHSSTRAALIYQHASREQDRPSEQRFRPGLRPRQADEGPVGG